MIDNKNASHSGFYSPEGEGIGQPGRWSGEAPQGTESYILTRNNGDFYWFADGGAGWDKEQHASKWTKEEAERIMRAWEKNGKVKEEGRKMILTPEERLVGTGSVKAVLANLANSLDAKGHTKEAQMVDEILKKHPCFEHQNELITNEAGNMYCPVCRRELTYGEEKRYEALWNKEGNPNAVWPSIR